ncbi:serine protease [Lysobacter silvisoli]|uniref:Serine protease n=1 Tax=Lysobacter silvisoli TaxID=2293254 RepID=A0A371K3T1_9GAMM|nr:serine protease [Lysobacter silvisoli]
MRLRAAALLLSALASPLALAQDPPQRQRISSRALQGELRQRPQGVTVPAEITQRGDRLVLQTADAAVPVVNPGALGQNVRQLPVQVVVSDTPAGVEGVRIGAVKLQATERWRQLSPQQRSKFGNVDAAQRRLGAAAESALRPNATPADLGRLRQAVDATERQVLSAYRSLPPSQRSEQRVLVEQHSELRRAKKSLYGLNRDDRYPPQAYERIYANSRGAFALRVRGEEMPRCSAVLIGETLALTNNHCILEDLPSELEAVFDYEDDLDGRHLDSQVFPIADIRLTSEEERDNLDFVLLELGANPQGALPGAVYPPQCLSLKPVRRDDPLYVIGFPLGGPRTVHDNSYVYFPFLASADEFAEIEILVRSEFATLEDEQQSYIDGKLKEFIDSYRPRTAADGSRYYEYVSVRFGDQPTIGADSDTYHGNSGSPVYSRRNHAVVGLLFDGQEDTSQPWSPGWRAHEAILPIGKVVERLDTVAPDWRSDPRLCVRPAS